MTKAVFCITKSIEQTEVFITNLKMAGFSNSDISVLFPDISTTKGFAHENHTKAPEVAAIGGHWG
jgi:hypothetical protein